MTNEPNMRSIADTINKAQEGLRGVHVNAVPRMSKLPEITIKCDSFGYTFEHARFTANWTEGDARFHVWINSDGEVEETIHKNSIADMWMDTPDGRRVHNPAYYPHRTLDLTAKKNQPIREAILELIKDGEVLRSLHAAAKQKKDDEEAAKQSAYAEKMRNALLTEGATLGDEFASLVKSLSEEQLHTLAKIVHSA
ncbi:hypothetical protein KEU06_09240 [Pseudaminobacter sp. 19-2017]|uniref:Uncharacterized protein n=1 Tax=Pseudaminobacter soli (ex Zhang et al. 2022) TaxID=2831468 RepID=A0A942E0A0_9HYPH|nr:hypothetical protein [Pseudaminobacter soli]MBS3648788.1 hypothetical protein [Pseudaminobacter soli]